MPTVVDIGTLIERSPEIRRGRPCITGTGVTVRRIAGWRKVGQYPGTTSYSPAELVSGILAGSRQHVQRPIFDAGSGPFHDHKGFNWMVLRKHLQRDFVMERVLASPFAWLGPHLATQAWLIARAPA